VPVDCLLWSPVLTDAVRNIVFALASLLANVPYEIDGSMAETQGEIPNQLLDTLEEWNDYLEAHAPYFKEPGP